MPTYEYACAKCGHQWEEIQKITEPPLVTCPHCKKKSAQRQISGGNFILKGGGWYSDLYSSPKPKADKGEGAKAEGAKTEGGAKTDSKADGTSETKKESAPPPKKDSSSSAAGGGGSGSKSSA